MKRGISLALLALLLILGAVLFPLAGMAQSGNPDWGEILNPDGSINWNNLTYAGETSEQADWMSVEIGGVRIPVGNATYNRYVTPSGQILVLPSPATMFFSYLNPHDSGLTTSPPSVIQNGAGMLAMAFGALMNDARLQEAGYTSSEDFFQAVIDGKENVWTFLGPAQAFSFLSEILKMSIQSGYPVTAMWLYSGAICEAIPGGCPPGFPPEGTPTPGGPTPTPGGTPPPPVSCPDPFTVTGPITVSGAGEGGKKAPLKPVVVGQDPEKRGVDLEVSVHIPPVEYHYYIPVPHKRLTCAKNAAGNGGGCPGPASRYDDDKWDPSKIGNPGWEERKVTEYECEEHVQVFPDFLDYATVGTKLTAESRDWILTNLAAAYPGAHLMHPDWLYTFPGPGSLAGKDVVWTQLIPGIQTYDPGAYRTTVGGQTTGTPVSSPRRFSQSLGTFLVELLRVTLVEGP